MIKRFLPSLEDPNRPLLGPNYWLLFTIGMLCPKNFMGKFWRLTLYWVGVLFVISQYIELIVIRSDLDLVLTNLKISMLSTVSVIKVTTFLYWQDKWRQVIDYITEADKFERDNQDETKETIINTYTKYSRRVTYIYWSLAFSTAVTTIVAPLVKYVTSKNFRASVHNGTEPFPHIIDSWMPFDKNSSPGCWITLLWHTGITFYGASIVAAYDASVMVILVYFGGKLDLLAVRCREMLGTDGKRLSDEEADKVFGQLHTIHVLLLKYSRLFNSVSSPVMFSYVVMCSLMICSSAFQLTSSTNTAQKVMVAEYLIFGVLQLLLFCWHCDVVIEKSQAAVMGPYDSEWWAVSRRQRMNVLILQGQLRIAHIFTAGPFTNLTLDTFIKVTERPCQDKLSDFASSEIRLILKAAYSYYTMIRE